MTITVRRLRQDEWTRWRELRLRALGDAPEAFGSTHERESAHPDTTWLERTHAAATSATRAIFIAESGGGWLGCAGVFTDLRDHPAVVSMWVAPEARRMGIATRLLEALCAWAARHGHSELRLLVVESQQAARALYASFGFEPTGRTWQMDRDPSITEIEMALDLRRGATRSAPPRARPGSRRPAR